MNDYGEQSTFDWLTMYRQHLIDNKKMLRDLINTKIEFEERIELQTAIVLSNQENFDDYLDKFIKETRTK